MARSVTIQSIVDRARLHSDQRDSQFVSDDECIELLNEIFPELYDLLVSIDENYYMSEDSIDISADTMRYDLPDDFYKLTGVDFSDGGGGQYVTLYPFPEGERNQSFTPGALPSGSVRLRYIPAPTVFTALTDTVDGVSGWDRLLSLLLAIDMGDAEESNTDRLYRKYETTLKRIQQSLQRDLGMPGRVTDVTMPYYTWAGSVRYRLFGNQIEFVTAPFNVY